MRARACRRSGSSTSQRAPTPLPSCPSPGSACVCRRAVRVRSPICGRPLHLVGEGNQCGPLRPAAGRRRETDRLPGGWTRLIQGAQVGVRRLSAEVLIFKRPLWNARSADCADNITLSRSPIFRHADDEQGDRAMPHPLRSLAFATSLVTLTALTTTPSWAQAPVPDLEQQIRSRAAQIEDKLIAWRREIHQSPELGEQETRTAGLAGRASLEARTRREDRCRADRGRCCAQGGEARPGRGTPGRYGRLASQGTRGARPSPPRRKENISAVRSMSCMPVATTPIRPS